MDGSPRTCRSAPSSDCGRQWPPLARFSLLLESARGRAGERVVELEPEQPGVFANDGGGNNAEKVTVRFLAQISGVIGEQRPQVPLARVQRQLFQPLQHAE